MLNLTVNRHNLSVMPVVKIGERFLLLFSFGIGWNTSSRYSLHRMHYISFYLPQVVRGGEMFRYGFTLRRIVSTLDLNVPSSMETKSRAADRGTDSS